VIASLERHPWANRELQPSPQPNLVEVSSVVGNIDRMVTRDTPKLHFKSNVIGATFVIICPAH
jgi:hypothetical protein